MVAECEDVASSHGYACKDMQEVIEFSTLNSDKSTEARLIKGMSSRPRYFECSCEGGYGNLSIIPGGDIYPCHLYIGHKEYQMASLKEDRYIFNDIYDVLEKGSKNNELCKKCWARVFCSMCPAVIGLSEPALEFMCSVEKEAIRKMILKYTKSMFLEKQRKEEMVHA